MIIEDRAGGLRTEKWVWRKNLQKLEGTIEVAKARGRVPTYFMQMLAKYGGVKTARRSLAVSEPQTGLFELYHLDLLRYSMEAVVIQAKFAGLFTEDEIAEARRRLEELGYFESRGE